MDFVILFVGCPSTYKRLACWFMWASRSLCWLLIPLVRFHFESARYGGRVVNLEGVGPIQAYVEKGHP